MLRTAEEIFKEEYDKADFITHKELAIICIKIAQKNAIEECAKIATVKHVPPRMSNMDGVEVNKQSILSLIKELK